MNLIKRAKSSLFLYVGIIFILLGITLNFFSHGKVLSTHTVSVKPTSKVLSNTPSPTAVVSKTNKTYQPTSSPTSFPSTPSSSSNTSQSTSASSQTINIQISEPDGINNFTVPTGGDACGDLVELKNEGKIKSVNLQWYASFNSYYVYEMNGYTNNWTFTYNGQTPDHGCSFYHPNSGDTIVWKFT